MAGARPGTSATSEQLVTKPERLNPAGPPAGFSIEDAQRLVMSVKFDGGSSPLRSLEIALPLAVAVLRSRHSIEALILTLGRSPRGSSHPERARRRVVFRQVSAEKTIYERLLTTI